MVVLKTIARRNEVELFFNRYRDNPDCQYWEGHGAKCYRHNFNISIGEGTVFVAMHHTMSKVTGDSVDLKIKYNPNKVWGVELASIMYKFFVSNPFTIVKSFDLAIDIPINIKQIYPIIEGKMSRRVIDNGGDDKTLYFKERGSNGSIKIYNKKREANLPYELTRYEITFNPDVALDKMCFYKVDEDLLVPMYVAGDVQLDISIKGTDKVLLLACLEHYEYINELSRDKKKKIKEYISNLLCQVEIDSTLLNKTINFYFSNMIA